MYKALQTRLQFISVKIVRLLGKLNYKGRDKRYVQSIKTYSQKSYNIFRTELSTAFMDLVE